MTALSHRSKVVLKEYRADEVVLKRCYDEASLLQRCAHPAIVELEAIFHDRDFFYLQMPYYNRGTLLKYCVEENLPARALIVMLQSIAQALSHLHACG